MLSGQLLKTLTATSSNPKYRQLAALTLPVYKSYCTSSIFHKKIREACDNYSPIGVFALLKDGNRLKSVLDEINQGVIGNYLHNHFISGLNAYAHQNFSFCTGFLEGDVPLEAICRSFIQFCSANKMYLDPAKTLDSFERHNQLSDEAVKYELKKITPKPKVELNLLGFGLDTGYYEQELARYLVTSHKAEKVNIFGFDPYANPNRAIRYLSVDELNSGQWTFDLIVARWVLHHVAMNYRWDDFVNCINRCNPGAEVLIVEHGFLAEASLFDRRVSALFNAVFDIVANIGLRPDYFFKGSALGEKFFIHYLEPKDFSKIASHVSVKVGLNIYDVGPVFPNQSICKMTKK